MAHLKKSPLSFIPLPPSNLRPFGAAPSRGRSCRAQRGGVGFLFLRRSRLLFAFPLGKGVVSRKAVSPYRSLPHWGRGTALAVDRVLSYNGALETIFFALFHPAIPIQPPPLRGTSFQRKEGVSTRAPSLGRGCRAQRGGVGFLFGRRSRLLFASPLGKGVVSSGILVSQPSPLGKGDRVSGG